MSHWSEIAGRLNDVVLDRFGDSENPYTYRTKDGVEFPLDGILERAPVLVDLQGNVQQSGDEWTFDYKASDFLEGFTPHQGDQLYRYPECYEVSQVEDDGEGMPRLRLLKRDA